MKRISSLILSLAMVPVAVSAAPIKVGIANDISGPFAAIGAEARDGFNLAIKQLDNTLGGQPAEFIQTDMGGNPDQARQLVDRYLKRENIDFFTGPIGSNVALAVGRDLTRRFVEGIVLIRRAKPELVALRASKLAGAGVI